MALVSFREHRGPCERCRAMRTILVDDAAGTFNAFVPPPCRDADACLAELLALMDVEPDPDSMISRKGIRALN